MFLAALVVRLHWNLVVHPPGDYVFSDMNGYVQRADRVLREPFGVQEYAAFFPFGTHVFVAGIKALFGRENFTAIGIAFALLGAITVALAHAVARRASRFRVVAPAVGLLGVFYYPHVSSSGYVLSETPFAACFMAAILASLRLTATGHRGDAWRMGLFAGLGALFRPQIMLSVALFGVHWLVHRRALARIQWGHLLRSAVPLVFVLGLAAAHFHHHTGRYGVVSENGTFNLVFGRCHNTKIQSLPDGRGHGKLHFRPPPLLQVEHQMEMAHRKGERAAIELDPAIGPVLTYRGYIGDRVQHLALIRECIATTGLARQLAYAWDNLVLLWHHNVPWPDTTTEPWRKAAHEWTVRHRQWLTIPALLGLVLALLPVPTRAWPGWLPRPGPSLGLVAIHLVAILLLAAIYFGDTRTRVPYDFVIMTLAFEAYATVGAVLLGAWRRYRSSRHPSGGSSSQNSSSS